jgi:uncharacterized protein (DUF488 family)
VTSSRPARRRRRPRTTPEAAAPHPPPLDIATIGVYGFDLGSFLGALRQADVTLLVDVRQRRGVRGPRYAWANSTRLQEALREAGIGYRHELQLAPTRELRLSLQSEYAQRGIGQRSRRELSPEYIRRFREEILDSADLDSVVAALPANGRAVLLCLETEPDACHRSLVAERLADRYGAKVTHLRPGTSTAPG